MELILVDTSVLSFIEKADTRAELYKPHLIGRQTALAFMTVAELYRWAIQRNWGDKRIAEFVARLKTNVVLGFDDETAWHWARLRAMKGRPIGFADAWIAATALRHGLPLVTHNSKDFDGIPGLKIISEENA
jgi:tRNA(fMet)-specific endonuclease VapC